MSVARSALRMARSTIATLDAIGRARLARDGLAGRAARLHAACVEIAAIHELHVDVRGALPAGPAVIVANHVSYLDAIALAAALPCAPLCKSEVAAWPVIGTACAGLGVIFVDRASVWGRARALFRARAALAAGVPIVNFPEGTTTDGGELLPFRRGIFGLARLADVPIIPVAVRCARELAWYGNAPFAPHYARMTRLDAPHIDLIVGAPIVPRGSADALAALARHRIARMLRDGKDSRAAIVRVRVPPSRPDAVLPLAGRAIAR